MDPIRAGRVYISEGVLADPDAGPRARRLADAIEAPSKQIISDREVDALQAAQPWRRLPRRGRDTSGFANRVVFLDRMRWEREDGVFPGYRWAELRNARKEWLDSGVVCQSAVEIQSILGCSFDCSYCPYTAAITVTCDVERFVERLDELFASRPQQLLYKLNNRSDTLSFEPEYGLSWRLIERFARTDEHALMLYSKSANVEPLLDLDHRGHTIVCFTLSTPDTAARLEPAAPKFEERIRAAARCADAGYPVRFRFSPIVPFAGWRADLDRRVRQMAEQVAPELVTLWTLSMISVDELDRIAAVDELDPRFVEGARSARDEMTNAKGAPFPDELLAEIYEVAADAIARHSPSTKVALCLETPPVLDRLRPSLAVVGNQQVCNCGPRCTSGLLAMAKPAADDSPRPDLSLPDKRREGPLAGRAERQGSIPPPPNSE